MKSGIYMIINLSNNKVYVGSSKDLNRRKREHFYLLKNNKHKNNYLQSSYNKHGENMFKFIITENCDIENLISRENFWIDIKKSNNSKHGYNLSIPEEKGGYIMTEITREKLRRISYKVKYGELTEEEYQQKLTEKEEYNNRERLGNPNKKRVFAFNKNTGVKEYEFESIFECIRKLNVSSSSVEKALSKDNSTCKGLILVKEEDYNPEKQYIKTYKTKIYQPVGPYQGKPVETFNLETQETIKEYITTEELATEFNITKKYVYRVLCGERKSFKGMGIRYS